MAGAVELYQIYYDDNQVKNIFPFATPYFNQTLTPFFENSVIEKLVINSHAEKIGVCSWQLKDKLRFYIPPRRELTEDVLKSDYDVLMLSKNSKAHQMLARADAWHSGFTDILRKIFTKIGLTLPLEVKNPVYFNHFIAKTEIYRQYVTELLSPAMQIMSEDVELMGLCWQDSRYTHLKGEFPKTIKQNLGVDYYPMHPFLCERFFSCWINDKNYNVQYL